MVPGVPSRRFHFLFISRLGRVGGLGGFGGLLGWSWRGDGTVAGNKKQRHKHPDVFNLLMTDNRVHDVLKSIPLLFSP